MTTPGVNFLYLTYIEAAAQECLEFAENLSFGDFFDDRKTRAAVVWQICVIGEAANRINNSVRQQAPEIDWRRMSDMRNILIHEFHNINYEIVWRTVQEELPPLIGTAKRLRGGLDTRAN